MVVRSKKQGRQWMFTQLPRWNSQQHTSTAKIAHTNLSVRDLIPKTVFYPSISTNRASLNNVILAYLSRMSDNNRIRRIHHRALSMCKSRTRMCKVWTVGCKKSTLIWLPGWKSVKRSSRSRDRAERAGCRQRWIRCWWMGWGEARIGSLVPKTTEDLEQIMAEKDEMMKELERNRDERARDKEQWQERMAEMEKGSQILSASWKERKIDAEGKLSEAIEENCKIKREAENLEQRYAQISDVGSLAFVLARRSRVLSAPINFAANMRCCRNRTKIDANGSISTSLRSKHSNTPCRTKPASCSARDKKKTG